MDMNEQWVRQYLLEHPEFLLNNHDVLPTNPSKVKDFREAQLAKIQADNRVLGQRQQAWVSALQENQQLANVLWHSAAALAKANGYKQVLQVLDDLLFKQLDFPAQALKLLPPQNKRTVPAGCDLQAALPWDGLSCQVCDHLPAPMHVWFERDHESHLVLALHYQGQHLGYWVIASDVPAYFHPDLDTSYLEAYAQVLSASLARLMGV